MLFKLSFLSGPAPFRPIVQVLTLKSIAMALLFSACSASRVEIPNLSGSLASNSKVASSSTTVLADNLTTSSVTVTLLDANQNPVASRLVGLTSHRGALDTIVGIQPITNASGIATFSVRSAIPGTAVLSATNLTDGLAVSSTVSIDFALAASAHLSTVVATPSSVSADGTSASIITVMLKDTGGSPVSGDTIILTSSRGSSDTIIPAYANTNSSGVATFTVKSSTAGASVFSALEMSNGVTISQTASVGFTTVASPSASLSSVSASLTSVVDDGVSNSKIMVILNDTSGNPVPGKVLTLASSRGATDTITPASGTTNSSGLVIFTVTSTTAGTSTYTATDTTDSLAISPSTATVTFITGPAALISVVSGNNQSAAVASLLSSYFVVKVTDSTANVINGATVNWAITAGGGTLSSATTTTDSNGLTQSRLTLGQTAGTNSVTATINGTSVSTTFTATGTPGPTNHFSVSGYPTSVTAGTSHSFTVTALNESHNTVTFSAGTVSCSSNDPTATLPADSTLTSGVGTFNATLNKVNGTQTLIAMDTVSSFGGSQTGITVIGTATTPAKLQLSGAVTDLAGACGTFTVTVQNPMSATTPAIWPVTVNLTGGGGTFYTDACGSSSVGSVLIPAGQTQATFYYKNLNPENPGGLQASDAASVLSSDTLLITNILAASWPTQIAAKYNRSCAVQNNGTVWCFGRNYLGNSSFAVGDVPIPLPVQGLAGPAASVAVGEQSTCALLTNGSVQCWGNNGYGQLGNNSTTSSSVPVTVSGISTATAVAAGSLHSCALLAGGSVQCWGSNSIGQLGNNSTTNSSIPVTVSGITTATAIAAGSYHTCALLSGGSIQCWGSGLYGRLGNNSTTNSSVPVTVSGISTATAIDAGYGHSCGVLAGGTLQCWGYNGNGQLGNNSITQSLVPVSVSGISTATAVSTGSSHSCALLSDHSARCWGYNVHGQLGNNSTTQSLVPVVVSGLSSATAISAGASHTCSMSSVGSPVQCWGTNSQGQAGLGSLASALVPTAVLGMATSAPAQLFFLSGVSNYSSAAEIGACTSVIVIGTGSSGGLSTPFLSDTQIDLQSSLPTDVHFYSDSTYTQETTSTTIPAGSNSAKIYFCETVFSQAGWCSYSSPFSINAQSHDGSLLISAPIYYQVWGGGTDCW